MIGKIEIVQIQNLLYMSSVSNYTEFYMKDGSVLIASKSMKEFQTQLNQHPDFIKVHRSHIVNKNYVKQIIKERHRSFVIMDNKEKLEVAQQKKEEILINILY